MRIMDSKMDLNFTFSNATREGSKSGIAASCSLVVVVDGNVQRRLPMTYG